MVQQNVQTGVGRIVWGNPGKSQHKKDQETNALILKDGQPIDVWAFGLAIPKQQFIENVWPAMAAEAAAGFGAQIPPKFSWKYKDGDGVDDKGKPYSDREGYAGCYVLTISTEAFAPPIFKLNAAGNNYDVMPGEAIKTGDYVAVSLMLKVNVPTQRTHTPGLYVNPQGIEFVGYGAPIVNGPDAMTMFGGTRHALPPGASTQPMQSPGAPGMPQPQQPAGMGMPQPGGMPGQPPMQQQPMQAPAQPQYAPQPQQPAYAPQPAQPGGMPAPGTYPPAPDFVPAAMGQPMQPAAPQMPGGMPGQPQYAPQPAAPGGMPQMPGFPPGGMQ